MSSLRDVPHSAIIHLIGARNSTIGGLATAGASQPDIKTVAANVITVGGVLASIAATDPIDISAAKGIDGNTYSPTALATGYTRYYGIGVTLAGVFYVCEGVTVANGGTVRYPDPGFPDGVATIGAVKVVNTSVGDFTFGTTNLDVAGITDTYVDLAVMPA